VEWWRWSLRENGKKLNDKEDIQKWSECCGCERKAPIKWEDSVGILKRERRDRRLRGMERKSMEPRR